MKNKTIVLLGMLMLVFSIFTGCTKHNEKQVKPDQALLNKDPDFITLTTEMNSFLGYLHQEASKNRFTQKIILDELTLLQNKNLSFEEQMNALDKLFKTTLSVKLREHMKVYTEIWPEITSRYGFIDQQILENECAEVLQENRRNYTQKREASVGILFVDESAGGDCGWRYSLCVAAATAGAILCDAACATTTLAMPICVLACATLQTYAGVQCYDAYCK